MSTRASAARYARALLDVVIKEGNKFTTSSCNSRIPCERYVRARYGDITQSVIMHRHVEKDANGVAIAAIVHNYNFKSE